MHTHTYIHTQTHIYIYRDGYTYMLHYNVTIVTIVKFPICISYHYNIRW